MNEKEVALLNSKWKLTGEYLETCSCDYLCPCIIGIDRPTQGHCTFVSLYRIVQGWFGDVLLNNTTVVVVARTPEAMSRGNWSVGVIIDERATPDQIKALSAIFRGEAGGPMAAMASVTGTFLGVQLRSVSALISELRGSLAVGEELDQQVECVGERARRYLDTPGHAGGDRLALARATRNHVHVFGLDWDATPGQSNGHLAHFSWEGS